MAGIYIHVPFCKSRCNYCNFFSVERSNHIKPVIDCIIKETDITYGYLENEKIGSLYIGGGTPSVLRPDHIKRLIDHIKELYFFDEDCEVTIEVNPDDIYSALPDFYIGAGINRISLGIQSFYDSDLHLLERRHDKRTSIRAFETIKNAGFGSLSIDLIYGIPGQTDKAIKYNLQYLIDNDVPHISCYALTIEPETPIHKAISAGRIKGPDEESALRQFNIITDKLTEAGYLHYEISNFAKPGHIAKHNTNYWKNKKYLGIGPSAHSYNGVSRHWNHSSIKLYMEGVKKGSAIENRETLSTTDHCNEYLLTRLRTMWGVNIDEFARLYGRYRANKLLRSITKFVANNLMRKTGSKISLTQKGKFVSDSVISSLFFD